MSTETTAPADRAKQIRDRLNEIAPWPGWGSEATPESMARWLLVHAQREWAAHVAPSLEPGGPDMDVAAIAKMNAQFAAGHALLALIGTGREAAVTGEIAEAWCDGGGVGEWLHEHLAHLGVDPDEVSRLEGERVALGKRDEAGEAAP